jgi:hypothetical protein
MSITSSSMLVELNISVWTANKLDKEATNKVTDDAYAVRNAAQVRKNLMAGTSRRKEIADFAASCRLWHNQRTLPWSDKGSRLLPTSLFLDYKNEANTRRAKFEELTATFLEEYPDHVAAAQQHLGDLFQHSDYPNPQEVSSKFAFKMVFSPVPEAGDFRLDVPHQELADIRREYEENFTSRLADAMRAPWEQLHSMLQSMSNKLTDIEGDEAKKRYHGTLLTNAQDLCAMLTHLNLTKDPALEAARVQLEQAIFATDIDDIKESAAVRADVKAKIDDIISKYEW